MANIGPLGTAVCCLIGVLSLRFLAKLYYVRQDFRGFQRQGLPMPPHHPLLGHIPLAASIVRSLPKHAAHGYLADQVRRRYPNLEEAFYLDLWPFAPRILMVISPAMIHEFTQDRYLPKHPSVQQFLDPIAGKHNLLTMEGSMWKQWRGNFNPGFSAAQVMNLVPGIVDEVVIFKDLLRERAMKREIFQLETLVLDLSIDIIGKVVMDHGFSSQRAENCLVSALRRQFEWSTVGIDPSPLEYVNFFRPIVQWYNARKMNSYLSYQLDLRYGSIRLEDIKGKSMVDVALRSYHASNRPSTQNATAITSRTMDTALKELIMSQIKVFLLAGHDTTASSLVYIYHLLAKHPSVLALVQEEHTSVFGPDVTKLPALLASRPHDINRLPLTFAVIKEALRLFPPAAAARAGQRDFFLSSPTTDIRFPTEHCLVWGAHHALHRNPRCWMRPEEFLPERWLVSEGDPLCPAKDAWRPFEKGPRACIGQELAIAELKIILALTVREFGIVDAYKEWDLQNGTAKREQAGVSGERAYQFIRGGGHPSDFYPCKVECLNWR